MMKKVISLVLAVSFVCASVMTAQAASFTVSGTEEGSVGIFSRTPTAMTISDFNRFEEVVSATRGKEAKVVNATRYNGSNTTWIVRVSFGDAGDQCAADFVVTCYPYRWNKQLGKDGQPIGVSEYYPWDERKADETDVMVAGTRKFGPCWYYYGLEATEPNGRHVIAGYAIAERINRWPEWRDLSFNNGFDPVEAARVEGYNQEAMAKVDSRTCNGRSYRNMYYTGSYAQSSNDFTAAHRATMTRHGKEVLGLVD